MSFLRNYKWLFFLIISLLINCDRQSKIDIYIPESLTKELLIGLWKNDSMPVLPDRADDSGLYYAYFSFGSDYSCICYLTSGLGFHVQLDGVYSIYPHASQINVQTENSLEFTLDIREHLYLYTDRFQKIDSAEVIKNWTYQINMSQGFNIKDLDTYINLKDLSVTDSAFFSILFERDILKYDFSGNIINRKYIPEFFTPPRNFIHHPAGLTHSDDFLYVAMICEINCHELYIFNFDSLNLIQRIPIDVTSHRVNGIAIDNNDIMWAVGNGWTGDILCYLHGINIQNGQEVIEDYLVNIIANGIFFHDGLLWGVRNSFEHYYLQGFDPNSGRVKYSIKLVGISPLLQLDQTLGIAINDPKIYFLNGLNHTVYTAPFPNLAPRY